MDSVSTVHLKKKKSLKLGIELLRRAQHIKLHAKIQSYKATLTKLH